MKQAEEEGKEEEENIPFVVIDNGAAMCKVGLAGNDSPTASIPSLVGTPKFHICWAGHSNPPRDFYCGEEAQTQSRRLMYRLQRPVQDGEVVSWENLERLWHHVFFQGLRGEGVYPEEQPVLLTEPPFNPKGSREKMAEILFETFDVPALCFSIPAVLSLFASGLLTGVGLDAGLDLSYSVPVCQGYAVREAIEVQQVAGSQVSSYLRSLLNDRGHALSTPGEQELVNHMKETLCYVAPDCGQDSSAGATSACLEKQYLLPDGRTVAMDYERFQAPEMLFQPSLAGMEHRGLQDMAKTSVDKCDPSLTRQLYSNVVLSGATTMFPGMADRMHKELSNLAPRSEKVKVIAPPDRKYSAWVGGSILASLSTFQEMLTFRQDYNESGPAVVHKKCF